jgi:predicted O-methyltransferase YrrM
MTKNQWNEVDDYITSALIPEDPILTAALSASTAGGLPAIQVSAPQGKFLHLTARSLKAARILEIGTLGGYSAIWLARALPPGGSLISLEINPTHAQVVRFPLECLKEGYQAERKRHQSGRAGKREGDRQA